MATLTETGEQVFAVLDETGRRRLSTLLLEDGRRYFVPAGAGASMKAAIWARNANTLLGSGRVA